jgi:glycosyltransferase involved in cell wall biosynthesis
MRVLHVNKFLYRRGGAESYMFDLAALQTRAGHEVEFFGMTHPDNEPQRYAAEFPSYVELEPPPSGLRARAAAVGRMVWSPASRRGLAAVLADFRPDIVHMHNVYHQLSPSVLAATGAAGVPVVLTLHDYKLVCPSYQMLDSSGRICDSCIGGGPLEALRHRCKDGSLGSSAVLAVESWLHRTLGAWSPVAAFVCPSEFLAATMTRAGVFPDRMHVVNHFVELAGVPAKKTQGGAFLVAGRLSPEKGVDVAIGAVAAAGPDVTLDIAGEGPARAALEAQAAAQAPGRVRFHGRLGKLEVLALMRASTAVVVPSRWHENQPMVVLEALAGGVPVVTTRLGGLPELVRDGVDGVVIQENDPTALAGVLDRLAADPIGALHLGRSGRARVERDFTPARHLERLAEVYAAAAGRTGSGPRLPVAV